MATCRVCMADITWSETNEGVKVPLDNHEERDYGPDRYRVVVDGQRPIVEAIAEESPLRTLVDHRILCRQPRVM